MARRLKHASAVIALLVCAGVLVAGPLTSITATAAFVQSVEVAKRSTLPATHDTTGVANGAHELPSLRAVANHTTAAHQHLIPNSGYGAFGDTTEAKPSACTKASAYLPQSDECQRKIRSPSTTVRVRTGHGNDGGLIAQDGRTTHAAFAGLRRWCDPPIANRGTFCDRFGLYGHAPFWDAFAQAPRLRN